MPIHKIAIIAEAEQGRLHPAILDLAALVERLSENGPVEVRWLVVGSQAAEAGARLAKDTGYSVTALAIPPAVALTGELVCDVLHPLLTDMQPNIVALLHTSRSQDYAATLAITFDAAYITGVQGLGMQDGTPVYQRAVFGGKWMIEIQTDDRPVVLTVLPGYFKFEGNSSKSAEVDICRPSLPVTRTQLIEIRESGTEAALAQAETIVAAGRGSIESKLRAFAAANIPVAAVPDEVVELVKAAL